jgi:hypothetical protein
MGATNKCLAQSNNSARGARGTKEVDLPMNGGSTKDNDGAALLLPLKTSRLRNAERSELPIRGRPGMNPSHHGSDEQMFGVKQQVPHQGQGD